MDEKPQFSSIENCTHFTIDELLSLNLSISIAGGVCFFISVLIIALLIFYKAYQTLLQRLFVYLMVATALRELSLLSLIEHYFYYAGQEEMCIAVAYFNHWTVALALVFTMGILIYMFYLVRRLSKGKTLAASSGNTHSNCRRNCLEFLYVFLLVVVTFVYGAEPYIRGSYGLAGAWCWIVSLDDNCKRTESGLLEQLASYVFILAVGITGVVLMIFTAITYCRLPSNFREIRRLLRKTFVILACLLSFVAFHVITINVRIFSTKHEQYQHFTLWIVHAMAQSISFLLFPFGFILSFYPTGAITKCYRACCHSVRICVFPRFLRSERQRRNVNVTPHSTMGPTAPKSTHVSQPSSTFFHAPYTNAFTHITSEDASLPKTQTDTGYGSISQ